MSGVGVVGATWGWEEGARLPAVRGAEQAVRVGAAVRGAHAGGAAVRRVRRAQVALAHRPGAGPVVGERRLVAGRGPVAVAGALAHTVPGAVPLAVPVPVSRAELRRAPQPLGGAPNAQRDSLRPTRPAGHLVPAARGRRGQSAGGNRRPLLSGRERHATRPGPGVQLAQFAVLGLARRGDHSRRRRHPARRQLFRLLLRHRKPARRLPGERPASWPVVGLR